MPNVVSEGLPLPRLYRPGMRHVVRRSPHDAAFDPSKSFTGCPAAPVGEGEVGDMGENFTEIWGWNI